MSAIDTSQPMSVGALVALAGVLLTWSIGAIAIRKFVLDERRQRKANEVDLEGLIKKVCQSFTESDEYQLRRDRAMITIAASVCDEAFRIRASSFVDAAVDQERRHNTERRIAAVEASIQVLRTDFAAAALRIADEVAKEVVKKLRDGKID